MSSLAPGATAGPVDMSVTVNLYTPEAALLAQALGESSIIATLRGRLLDAGKAAEGNGAATLQIKLSPSEQGLLVGAMRHCTCQFSAGLRFRIQQLMTGKLLDLGAPLAL